MNHEANIPLGLLGFSTKPSEKSHEWTFPLMLGVFMNQSNLMRIEKIRLKSLINWGLGCFYSFAFTVIHRQSWVEDFNYDYL